MLLAPQDIIVIVMTFINIALTAVLVYIYFKSYRAIPSKITLGLLFFIGAFLLENLANLYFYASLVLQSDIAITTFIASITGLEMIGLLILLYTSWK